MLLSIVSAILLILAFPNFNLNYLVFVGFLPLFFAIQNKSPKTSFLISYLCGFLFYMGVLYWLYHVTVIGLIIVCLYLAMYFGVLGFLVALLQRSEVRSQKKKSVLCSLSSVFCLSLFIPTIWVVLEYIQSRLFTGFGWASMGYSQYKNLPLIQIADFSGVWGVSFLIMMVNVVVWRLIKLFTVYSLQFTVEREKILYTVRCTLYTMVLVLSLVYGYGFFRLGEKDRSRAIKVSVIQGNIPQDTKWDPDATSIIMNRYVNLTRKAAFDDPDLIVWPETSFPGFFENDRGLTNRVLDLAKEIKKPLLLGANTEEILESFNSAVLISEAGEIVDNYDKIHLVPFGEYVPFSDRFPVLHNMILGELGEFTAGKDFKIFSMFVGGDAGRPLQFSVLICFEDIFPELAKGFIQNGAQFLVVITNDAWYGNSPAAYQHAACSVFRAIENRVSVVRCANTGYSCFIDSRGRIYDSVEEDTTHLFITGHKTSLLKL